MGIISDFIKKPPLERINLHTEKIVPVCIFRQTFLNPHIRLRIHNLAAIGVQYLAGDVRGILAGQK